MLGENWFTILKSDSLFFGSFLKLCAFDLLCSCRYIGEYWQALLLHFFVGSHGTEETSVVFYRVDDKYLAVGYLQPSRRTLHGQTLPSGVDVVLVRWVDSKEEEVPPPLVIGDTEENAKLCPGQLFAFPRTCLAKVKVIWTVAPLFSVLALERAFRFEFLFHYSSCSERPLALRSFLTSGN